MKAIRVLTLVMASAAFQVSCGGDSAGGSDDVNGDGSVDGGGVICETTGRPISVEICDGIDNDCNGRVDEIFDFQTDVNHCGMCNHKCEAENAQTACVGGVCKIVECPQGLFDLDGDLSNGCESSCEGTAEKCDGRDNDCDGLTDEDFDLMGDIENCGDCGLSCARPHAVVNCANGQCAFLGCEQGYGNFDGDTSNGCEATCTPSAPGPEICDGEDNDCDGETDEGFDLMVDGENCGRCGHRCSMANGAGACRAGECVLVSCQAGYVDADGDPENGCESFCEVTNGGVERCDGIDNDCDSLIDEDFDFASDPENCGGCGELNARYVCQLPNAHTSCVEGSCQLVSCNEGFIDDDGDPSNGCETICNVTNDGVELCDGIDNDCNGQTDEGFYLMRDVQNCGACGHVCSAPNAEVDCQGGQCVIASCHSGFLDANRSFEDGCEQTCVPQNGGVEQCNGIDDDCDGATDEDFQLQTDPANCGACGRVCSAAHGSAFCNNGVCMVLGCDEGYVDLDGNFENGCECVMQNGGVELCNGIDDDCNGIIDDPERMAPPQDFTPCKTRGVCRDSVAKCIEQTWVCVYPDNYEVEETLCDGLDNDCDGDTDESFVELGRPCQAVGADGLPALGVCAESGTIICDGLHATKCSAEPHPERMTAETCNGLDDDCDGEIDEDSQITTFVSADASKGVTSDFRIFRYEASRTDASDRSSGQMFDRACSKPNVLPWNNVDYETAKRACESSGCTLCTAEQWSLACGGVNGSTYPYGATYDPGSCNGQDFDVDPTRAGLQDGLVACGSLESCVRSHNGSPIYDLSGNVWEWTADLSSEAGAVSAHNLRGGGYGNMALGLTCSFLLSSPDTVSRGNVGFRCCCDAN